MQVNWLARATTSLTGQHTRCYSIDCLDSIATILSEKLFKLDSRVMSLDTLITALDSTWTHGRTAFYVHHPIHTDIHKFNFRKKVDIGALSIWHVPVHIAIHCAVNPNLNLNLWLWAEKMTQWQAPGKILSNFGFSTDKQTRPVKHTITTTT